MSRFFVPPGAINGDIVTISGKEAHHIKDVMRLSVGDKVVVFDGTGTEYIATISGMKPRLITANIYQSRKVAKGRGLKLRLIQAVPKKDKMDYIIEKATELGVSEVIPIVTERTIPQWDDRKSDSHLKRWRVIATEAAKQCGRVDVPEISYIKKMEIAVKENVQAPVKIIAALSYDAKFLGEVLSDIGSGDIVIAIGPEGDFTAKEVRLAKEAGFAVVSLGPRVLKSDTAGLAVLAMVNYEFYKSTRQ